MHHAIDRVRRVGVGGRAGGLYASSLVDGHVHNHRALLHLSHHGAGNKPGSGRAGDQHAADDQVRRAHGAFDVVAVGGECVQASVEDVVQLAQAIQVAIDQRDASAHAERDPRRVGADNAAAQHQNVAGRNAGNAAQQHAASSVFLLQIGRANLHAHAAGDLAHGGEQGKRAAAVAHRLVGDAGDFVGQQRVGEGARRRQVQVGEDHQALAEVPVLLLDGLLDLDHHLGQPPYVVGGANDLCPGGLEVVVGHGAEFARVVLHQHRMPCRNQRVNARRSNADAALVVLHFLRYANNHLPHPGKSDLPSV